MKEIKGIEQLNELYEAAASADKPIFAEMRSNILLENGEQYKKISNDLARTLKDLNVNKTNRIRLVLNQIQIAAGEIKDIFLSQLSSFKPFPHNDNEIADLKSAELSDSVWQDGKKKNNWDDYAQRQTNSFVTVGECASKTFFDPDQGPLKGYHQEVDEEGQPLFLYNGELTASATDELGNELEMSPDESKPKFEGKIVIEKIYPFDLLRDPSCDTMESSPYLIHRKMVDIDKVKRMFANTDDEKANVELREKITESSKGTYRIFNASKAGFEDSTNQTMLREFYFRQCPMFPKGYFYIATDNVILSEGPIPFGEQGDIAFPIKHAGYEIIETCPRYSSFIRHARTYQIEINRTASSIVETQLTVGKDKLVLFGGGTASKGAELEGTRVIKVSGAKPEVIPGRSGEQFTGTLKLMIELFRDAVKLPKDNLASGAQVTDPRSELYKSAKLKKKFSRPALRLERFFTENVETYLFLASKYLDENSIVKSVGKKEAINIPEFKNIGSDDFAIKVEPVSGDLDSQWGKFMTLEVISQYYGKDMPDHLKPALIKAFPFLNADSVLKEMMVEHDTPRNMILGIDRGDEFIPSEYDNAELMLKSLYVRVREADFKLLEDPVKERYASAIAAYEGIKAKQLEATMRAQMGAIPSGGSLTKCDVYVNEPKANGQGFKVVRATIPSQSVEWLMTKLEEQGMAQETLKEMPSAGALSIAEQAQGLAQGQNTVMQPPESEINQPNLNQLEI